MFPLVKKIIDGVPLVRLMIDCAVDRTSISNIESAKFSTMSSSRAAKEREDAAPRRQNHLLNNIKSANLDFYLDKEHNVKFNPGSENSHRSNNRLHLANDQHKMGPNTTC